MFLWAKRHQQIFSIMMKTSGRLRAVRLCTASSQMPSPLQPCSCPSTAPPCPRNSRPPAQGHSTLSTQGDWLLQDPHSLPLDFRHSQTREVEISTLNYFLSFFPFTVSNRSCFHHYLRMCSSGLAAPRLPSWNEGVHPCFQPGSSLPNMLW